MTTTTSPAPARPGLHPAIRLVLALGTTVVLAAVGLLLGRTARGDDPRYELPEVSAAQLDDLTAQVESADAAEPATEDVEPGTAAVDVEAAPGVADTPPRATVAVPVEPPAAAPLLADGLTLVPNPGGAPDLTVPDLEAPAPTPTAATPAEVEAAFADEPELADAFTALDRAHRSAADLLGAVDVDAFVDPCTLGVALDGCDDGVAATVLADSSDPGRPLPAELRILSIEPVFDSDPAAPACRAQTGGDRGRDLWVAFRLNMPAIGTARLVFTDPDHFPAQRSFYGLDVDLEPSGAERTAWARSFDRGLTPEPISLCARIPRDTYQASPHYACPWFCSRGIHAFVDLEGIGGRRLHVDRVFVGQFYDSVMAEADALAEPVRITPVGDRVLRIEGTIQQRAGDGEESLREGRVLAAAAIPSADECTAYAPATNQPAARSRQLERTLYQPLGGGAQARATIELALPADTQPGETFRLCIYWIGSANRSFESDDVRRIEQHLVVPPTFPRVTFEFGEGGDLGAGPYELTLGGPLPRTVDRCDDPHRPGEVVCEVSAYELGDFFVDDGDPAGRVTARVDVNPGGSAAVPADGEYRPLTIPLDRRGCRGTRTFAAPITPRSDETVPLRVTCDLEFRTVATVVPPGQPDPVDYVQISDRWVIDPDSSGLTTGVVEADGEPAGQVLSILDSPPLLDLRNVGFFPVDGSLATATQYRFDLDADRPAHVVATLTPDGPPVRACPPIVLEGDTDDQGSFGSLEVRPCAGTRYGARVDLTALADPGAGTSTFGPTPGLVFETPTTASNGLVRTPGRYHGLALSGPPVAVRWSAGWTLQPSAGLADVRLEHIDLRIDGRTIPMGGASSASCRTLPESLPGDATGFQGPDTALVGVRRIEALVVLVPCDDPTGSRRQVVRLTGAAYLSNLAGGEFVTLTGVDARGDDHQLTLTFRDRPQ